MKFLPKLFENNHAWAEKIKLEDPTYFHRLSRTQTPGISLDRLRRQPRAG
jgi:carbonic anhydrase